MAAVERKRLRGRRHVIADRIRQDGGCPEGPEAQALRLCPELTMVPANLELTSLFRDAKKAQCLIDKLDELDDVLNVYSTMNITDEIAASFSRVRQALWSAPRDERDARDDARRAARRCATSARCDGARRVRNRDRRQL